MLTQLNNILLKLILFSVFLIPLTISDQRLYLNLGEFRNETYIYPFMLCVLIFGVYSLLKAKVSIPMNSISLQFLLLLLIWFLVTFFLSFPAILNSNFKGMTGVSRFLRQYFTAIFSLFITPIVIYNVFKKYSTKYLIEKIEKITYISLTIVFIFGIIEYASIVNGSNLAHSFIQWVNANVPIIFLKEDIYLKRVSSISHEPPFLGMYLIFVTPWVLRGLTIARKKGKHIIMLVMVITLVMMSKSRAGQLFCLLEIIVYTSLLTMNNYKFLNRAFKVILVAFLLSPVVLLVKGDDIFNAIGERIEAFKIVKNIDTNNSNKTRLGTIVAGLETFVDYPLRGVGYGQQGYYLPNRYPKWSVKGNWEIERYLNENEINYPPGFNLYVRLLAETGIFGFLLFSLFILFLIYSCSKKFSATKDVNYLLFITIFIGFGGNWIQIDTPRIFGFWVVLALMWVYSNEQKNDKTRVNPSYSTL